MHEILLVAASGLAGTAVGARLWVRSRRHARTRASGGERGPDFDLPAAHGGRLRLAAIQEPVVLVVFMSNRCPGVRAYDARLRALQQTHAGTVKLVGINSIDEDLYPREGLNDMARSLQERGLDFAYGKDVNQRTARSYGALCTPHAFVLDQRRQIRYRGRIDDSLLESGVERRFVEDAIAAILDGGPVAVDETAPLGCSIDESAPSVLTHRRAVPMGFRS